MPVVFRIITRSREFGGPEKRRAEREAQPFSRIDGTLSPMAVEGGHIGFSMPRMPVAQLENYVLTLNSLQGRAVGRPKGKGSEAHDSQIIGQAEGCATGKALGSWLELRRDHKKARSSHSLPKPKYPS